MGFNAKEFETFEQQFLELVGEFQSITSSERRLRESLRAECTRAEAAEAARDAAEHAATEARSGAAAASAAATQAATALAKAHDENSSLKMQLELSERQRTLLEEKCLEISSQVGVMERELQQLRPQQSAYTILQRQYIELQDRINVSVEEASREASQLENDLRRVEKSATAGAEMRERARLAAAAHARERRLTSDELHHTSQLLLKANTETARLGSLVAELQCRLAEFETDSTKMKEVVNPDQESVSELRAVLEAERAGSARLERALAAALADNEALAAKIHISDNADNNEAAPIPPSSPTPVPPSVANKCPLDSFLAD